MLIVYQSALSSLESRKSQIFYQGVVRKYLKRNSKIKLFVCGNKKAVIDAATTIKNRALPDQISTLFFVDHDFDYYFTKCRIPETVFCSLGYSFENYVIDRDNMELAWDSCVTTASSGLDFDLLYRLFMREYVKFAKLMLEFATQVICRRQNLRTGEKITLQNGRLGKLMQIDDDLIINYDANLLNELYRQVGLRMMKSGAKCVGKIKLLIKEKGSRYYIRGKYLIAFVQKFLEGIQALGKKIVTAQHEKSSLGKTPRKTSTKPVQTDTPCF